MIQGNRERIFCLIVTYDPKTGLGLLEEIGGGHKYPLRLSDFKDGGRDPYPGQRVLVEFEGKRIACVYSAPSRFQDF